MRDRKGWKALGYESFVEYGEKELGFQKSHIYELTDAAEIGLQIGFSAIAEKQPKESQLRPLKSVPEAERKAIWDEATRKAEEEQAKFTADQRAFTGGPPQRVGVEKADIGVFPCRAPANFLSLGARQAAKSRSITLPHLTEIGFAHQRGEYLQVCFDAHFERREFKAGGDVAQGHHHAPGLPVKPIRQRRSTRQRVGLRASLLPPRRQGESSRPLHFNRPSGDSE